MFDPARNTWTTDRRDNSVSEQSKQVGKEEPNGVSKDSENNKQEDKSKEPSQGGDEKQIENNNTSSQSLTKDTKEQVKDDGKRARDATPPTTKNRGLSPSARDVEEERPAKMSNRHREPNAARQEQADRARKLVESREKRLQNEPIRQHYNARPNFSRDARLESPIIELKNFNNLIKSLIIGRYTHPRDIVLDLGCGKGGDLGKWAKQGVRGWIGIDIADESVRQAAERRASMHHARFWIETLVMDPFTTPIRSRLPQDILPADIVSMQFVLHYAYGSEKTIRMLLRNISENLRDNCFFIGTIPDSRKIFSELDKFRSGAKSPKLQLSDVATKDNNDPNQQPQKKVYSWGNDVYRIQFDELPPPEQEVLDVDPYGHMYNFYLTDAVGNVPEYIVPFEQFRELCDSYGLELRYHKNFLDYYDEEMRKRPDEFYRMYQRMFRRSAPSSSHAIPPSQLEAAAFYCVFVFQKRPSSRRR